MDFQIIWDFLTNPLRQARNNGNRAIAWGLEWLHDTRLYILRALAILAAGFIIGLLMEKGEGVRTEGNFILHLCSVLAMAMYLYGWARLAVITKVAQGANEALASGVNQATRERVKFPMLIDKAKADSLLHAALGGLLAIAAAASYASIFPVWKNLTDFLGVVILATFCIVMVSFFHIPNVYHIERKLVIFAFLMLLVKTAGFILPTSVTQELKESTDTTIDRTIDQRQEDRKLQAQDAPIVRKKIEALRAEQRRILSSHAELTDADRDKLDDLKDQIQDIQSEDLAGGGAHSGFVYSTTHYKDFAALVGIALLIAAWRVFRTPSSSGGGH